MPARIIRPPCTRYQSECRLTDWRIASRIAWAAASSDMVMVRLHRPAFHRKIPRRHSAVLGTLTSQMMTGLNNVNLPIIDYDGITIYGPKVNAQIVGHGLGEMGHSNQDGNCGCNVKRRPSR